MKVTIHQPEFLPWLGFFHKISLADHVILLDDVQFRKNYFQNRNRILIENKPTWITIPVKDLGLNTPINQVPIAWEAKPKWPQSILDKVKQAYRKAECFEVVFSEFKSFFESSPELLVDINIPLIQWMSKFLGITSKFSLSSSVPISTSSSSQHLLDLCLAVGATIYISGISGREYLDIDLFNQAGIKVEFHEFYHPIYRQLQPQFQPQISSLEPIFLFGREASNLLKDNWHKRLETIFT